MSWAGSAAWHGVPGGLVHVNTLTTAPRAREQPGVPSLRISAPYWGATAVRPTPSEPAIESPTTRMRTGRSEDTDENGRAALAALGDTAGTTAEADGIINGSRVTSRATRGTTTSERHPASRPRWIGASTRWKDSAATPTITANLAPSRATPCRWVRCDVMTSRTGQYQRYMP